MLMATQLSGFGVGAVSAALTTVSAHSTLPTSLLAYWELEETSGTRVAIAGGFNLTDNNTVTQGTGKQGNCADFEQTTQEFLSSATNYAATISTGSYSASLWFKPESISSNNATYGSGLLNSTAGEADGSFHITLKSDGAIWYYRWTGATNRRFKTDTTPCSTLATWYHLIITYDSGSTTSTIYINGSSVASTDDAGGSSGWGTHTFIGNQFSDGSGGYAFDGLIDEVAIWSKLLTAQEISDLYNAGSGLPYD